jgi:hypothetical protein
MAAPMPPPMSAPSTGSAASALPANDRLATAAPRVAMTRDFFNMGWVSFKRVQ